MNVLNESQLPALFDGAQDVPPVPERVFARLQLLSRALRHAPPVSNSGASLLWFDVQGKIVCVAITEAGVTVGRDPACNVVLAGQKVSRRHCEVRMSNEEGEIEIADRNSTNGTLVNGVLIGSARRRLHDGDVVEVGGNPLIVLRPNMPQVLSDKPIVSRAIETQRTGSLARRAGSVAFVATAKICTAIGLFLGSSSRWLE